MSGTGDCDELGNSMAEVDAAFITAQSSSGYGWCTDNGFDNLWACGNPMVGSSLLRSSPTSAPCGPLKYFVGFESTSNIYSWKSTSILSEASRISKGDNFNGGVLCCKNVSASCQGNQYELTSDLGCADGSREYFSDQGAFPDVAGCAGSFSVAGLIDQSGKLVQAACNRSAGNDGLLRSGVGCSASDLCQAGWKICETSDAFFLDTRSRFCSSSDIISQPSVFLSAINVSSSDCSNSLSPIFTDGGFGCGNVNTGSYCQYYDVDFAFNSHVTCSNLPNSWNCNGPLFDLRNIANSEAAGGGVLCCREKKSSCADCIDSTCSAPIVPTITQIVPNNGPTSGEFAIELFGNYFATSGTVYIGDNECIRKSGQYYTNSRILCTVASSAGFNNSVQVVSSQTGPGRIFYGFNFDIPFILNIDAPGKSTLGNTIVTIYGKNFGTDPFPATILFGSSFCPERSRTFTQITCLLPSGQGIVSVSVQVAGQVSASYQFDYGAPSINGADGNTGQIWTSGNNRNLIIVGNNFGLSGTVTLNGILCVNTFWSHTRVSVIVPAGFGSALPLVIQSAGRNSNTWPFQYSRPEVAFVNPKLGGTDNIAGLSVTISGVSFGPPEVPVTVRFVTSSTNKAIIPSQFVKHVGHGSIVVQVPPYFYGTGLFTVQHTLGISSETCKEKCSFSFTNADILSISGCVDSGRLTRDCSVGGSQNITVVGYNFGAAYDLNGLPNYGIAGPYPVTITYASWNGQELSFDASPSTCSFRSLQMFNISLTNYQFRIVCTVPAFPSGDNGRRVAVRIQNSWSNWNDVCRLDPANAICDYITFRGPIIVSNSLRTCPSGIGGSGVFTSLGSYSEVVNVPNRGDTRICFNVTNLDGASAAQVSAYLESSGANFSCTTNQVADPVVSCIISAGLGANLRFRVQVYNQVSGAGNDTVSYTPASFVPASLRIRGTSEAKEKLTLPSTIGDWVSFEVNGLSFGAVAYKSLRGLITVTYGAKNSTNKEYVCNLLSIVDNIPDTLSTFSCRTSPGIGSGYVFQLLQNNQLSLESSFTIGYPVAPTVKKVSGCVDTVNGTFNCPTIGGLTLTIVGNDLCDFNPIKGNCTLSVQIGLNLCQEELVYLSEDSFTCPLPAATGLDVPIMIFQNMPGGIILTSPSAELLNYKVATIDSVSGCEDRDNTTILCSRYNSSHLTIRGSEFGTFGARVLINGQLCENVTHATSDSSLLEKSKTLYCDSRPQGELSRAVLVLQDSGRASANYGSVSYELCKPGTRYNNDNLTCLLCETGKFVNVEGAGNCVPCDSGQYTNRTGMSDCFSCTPGFYSLYGSSTCSKCQPGNISTSDAADTCIPCDVGRYNKFEASSVCLDCEPGKFTASGNTPECTDCVRGTYALSPGAKKCFSCSEGKYVNTTGASSCELCFAGKIAAKVFESDDGFTTCSPCPKGMYNDVAGRPICLPCPAGKYSYEDGSSTCTSCESGRFSNQELQTTCNNCTGGFFAAGKENVVCSICTFGKFSPSSATSCSDCPVGRYQEGEMKSTCELCGKGRFASFEGSINCPICSSGRVAPSNGASSCFVCKGGFFSDNPTESCKGCSSGTYSLEDSSSCLDCNVGYFNDLVNSSSCALCNPGTFGTASKAQSCEECPIGRFSNSFGALLCDDCEPGTYGTYSGQSLCDFCNPGTYQDEYAQMYCKICAPGTAAATNKTSECAKCLPGFYSNKAGAETCQSCTTGTFQRTFGQTYCFNCSEGTYSSSQASACADCLPGSYNVGKAQSSCAICSPGKYQDIPQQTFCRFCEPGFYSSGNAPVCSPCASRTISSNRGQAFCASCPDKSVADSKRIECLCQAGYFSNYSADTDSGYACIKCPVGAYCKFEGVRWETLTTSRGYWRASTNSINFYSCQFLSNCLGGRNSTCGNNRDGPVCALCRPGYETFGNSCRPCGTRGATIAVFVILVILIVCLVVGMYYIVLRLDKNELRKLKRKNEIQQFLEDEDIMEEFQMNEDENLEASTNGTPNRPPNFAYKMKILLGFFQISVGIAFAIEIPWPDTFKQFIALFNIANFDIVQWTRVGCVVNTTYLDKHLVVAITPLAIFFAILLGYLLPRYLRLVSSYSKGDEEIKKAEYRMKRVVRKFWKMFLFTLFLIYPTVSSIMVRLYSCQSIEGTSYLQSDFNVLCSSKAWFQRALLNIVFVVIYPIGIIFLFGWILFENRKDLHTPEALIQFGFLYGAFNRERWWFELLDMLHKLFMTSILPLFPNAVVLQVALAVLTIHMCSILTANPYARKGDDRLHLLAQCMLFVMVLCGLVYRQTQTIDETMDIAMSVVLIGMAIGLVLYVLFQVVSVARKLYKIRKLRKLKKEKGPSQNMANVGVQDVAEVILRKHRTSFKINRNPLFSAGTGQQDMAQLFMEQSSTIRVPKEVERPAIPVLEEAKETQSRKPITRQFVPKQVNLRKKTMD
jgi:hypothetical protein